MGTVFSYTQYGIIDKDSRDRGFVIGGKDMVTYQDMMKCCWPAYLTVMYDAEKVGMLQMKNLKGNNDYALLLIPLRKTLSDEVLKAIWLFCSYLFVPRWK